MNDLIFITHCCFTSHKSLQMEITADSINVSSDEPQTFFYVFSMLANGIMKLLLHSVGQVKKKKEKKSGNNHKYWLLIR